ncbi:fructosamine kinase family protein [Fulvimarina manganoxydans]|uniref:fructosamine kinase family protein n=1 Tax=Fulvimarina manganoxydans TaxID=937218 RepID=UPI0023578F27|nr:fructosamine kinase family protein [Fulvimarina manganoxydans]
MTKLAAAGERLLGGRITASKSLSGGDLSALLLVTMEDGRKAVLKGGPAPRTEGSMLEVIAKTGAPAPAVLAVDDDVLAIEWLASDDSLQRAWGSLGAVLKTLHADEGPDYGWPEPYAFGPVAIDNRPAADWPSFFAERRLMVHAAHIPEDLARRIEGLCSNLTDRLPKTPYASLLHGDCWSGNILVSKGCVTGLIDPASYYGDREVDLAMLHLFASPGPAFTEAYGSLAPGFEERRAIYTLWPALVHLRLFGSGYRRLVERLLAMLSV